MARKKREWSFTNLSWHRNINCTNFNYEPTEEMSRKMSSMRKTTGWSLQERRFVSRQNLVYKIVNGQAACDIPRYFPPQTPRTRVSHNTQFSLLHLRLDIYKYSFYPRTTRVWNILPQAIAHAPSAETFRLRFQQQITSGDMYVIPPRGQDSRPHLGSNDCMSAVGPVY